MSSSSSYSSMGKSSTGTGALNHSGPLVLTRPDPGQGVSLLTCSKLCGICFVAGILVGFTLKRRVKRWASKLLRKIRDD